MKTDVLIVGCGFAGAVIADCLATSGRDVVILDQRGHLGGNAFDETDSRGVLVHRYGPHIFHTNSEPVFDYLSRFTRWTPFEMRVLASVDGKLLPIPINRTTINAYFGLQLDEAGAAALLGRLREPRSPILTSEDVVLSSVGRELGAKFFQNYIRKQWGMDMSCLRAEVAARIPTRTNDDDRYFTDRFQCMPTEGYSALFRNMLDHRSIHFEPSTRFVKEANGIQARHVVYTGPIDEYFNCCLGPLPFRSLRFEYEHFDKKPFFQPAGIVSYPNEHAYTRITEFKHLTGQRCPGTTIAREYPTAEGDPYYPVPREENHALYQRYRALAQSEQGVTFVGRLAQYRYYNMDQVVGAALQAALEVQACTA